MSFLLNETGQLLKDQLDDLLGRLSTPDVLRETIEAQLPWSETLWRALADMGVPGATIPSSFGGSGLGPVEAGVILESLGQSVAPVPFLSTLLAAEAILFAGSEAQKARWLPGIARGEIRGTIAWTEGAGAPLETVATTFEAGTLTGSKLPVADAAVAQICVVVARSGDDLALSLVELNKPGVSMARLAGIDQLRSFSSIEFNAVPAERLSEGGGAENTLGRLLERAAVYCCFEQVGGTEAALMMARDYVLERNLFGRKLASFQTVKHRLAEVYRRLELARCCSLAAALSLQEQRQDSATAAATARISTNYAYDLAARENLQFHGGIGFTWEADCHFHYRRSRLLALQFGSTAYWSDRLVEALAKTGGEGASQRPVKPLDTVHDSDEDARYRQEVCDWLDLHTEALVSDPADAGERAREWTRLKAAAGYSAIDVSPAYGGAGGTKRQAQIFAEEEAARGLTVSFGAGYHQGMAAINRHGTEAQKTTWRVRTNTGQAVWCQLFSEPSAGSDLAAVRTRAVREGDHWIVTGQKVWTSGGRDADYGILIARTDPDVPKHAGLTFFIIDMHQPGVEVRPIRQINGQSHFTETFLDGAVIPDENRIGEPGEGWAVAMTVLAAERNTTGAAFSKPGSRSHTSSKSLIELARSIQRAEGTAFDSAAVRQQIAHFHMEAQGVKHFSRKLAEELRQGQRPVNLPIMKLTTTRRMQQVEAFILELQESLGYVQLPDEVGDKFFGYLTSASNRIAGGADEVLLSQLAERVLGMPGEIRPDKSVPFSALPA